MAYVFISYSSKNQLEAEQFKRILDRSGIGTWMAPGDIPLGSKYAQVINKAIKDSACLVLLLTDSSQNSVWVAKEVESAINHRKPLINVMLEDVVLNDEFEFYVHTDQGIMINRIDENTPEMKRVLLTLKKITSDDVSQDELAEFIVSKTPEMQQMLRRKQAKIWWKRALLLFAALLIGVGMGIGAHILFKRPEPAQPVFASGQADAARSYRAGVEFESKNPEEALEWYLSAANMGYTPGYLAVGRVSMKLEKHDQALEYLKKAAEHDAAAFVLIGELYEKGLGVPADAELAKENYRKGHDLRDRDATCALARLYADPPEGSGMAPDREMAVRLYEEAANDKHPEAAYRLGLLYEDSNQALAVQWLRTAYIHGYSQAETRLAQLIPADELEQLRGYLYIPKAEQMEIGAGLHEEPLTVQVPDNTGEVLLKASQGDPQAMLEAACLYYNGSAEKDITVDHELALAYLRKAGDAVYDHADAMVILARYCEGRENVLEADFDKAKDLYIRAADKGSPTAYYQLAAGYYNGNLNDGTPDYQKSFDWAAKGAEMGSPGCMNRLGVICYRGNLTGEPDYPEALNWFRKAAELKYPAAVYNVGRVYALGHHEGGVPDYNEALKWYEDAAELKYESAMTELADLYLKGKKDEAGNELFAPDMGKGLYYLKELDKAGVQSEYVCSWLGWFYSGNSDQLEPDYQKAAEYFAAGAELGDAYSMHRLGELYHEGKLGEPDYQTAVEWYEKAAELNEEKAIRTLTDLYANGKKDEDGNVLFAVNEEKALQVLQKALDAGNETAFVYSWLGWFHSGYSGVLEADYTKALEYYSAAAELGNAYSMNQLGFIYQSGKLGEPDYQTAAEWYEKAAELKEEKATGALIALYVNGRKDEDGNVLFAQNEEKALQVLRKALDAGNETTLVYSWMGWFYSGNSGVLEADYAKAVEYYTAAAELGDAYSMHQLGSLFHEGRLGEPDDNAAIGWYEKAAAMNYADSMCQLASLYLYDSALEDPAQAEKWLDLAKTAPLSADQEEWVETMRNDLEQMKAE